MERLTRFPRAPRGPYRKGLFETTSKITPTLRKRYGLNVDDTDHVQQVGEGIAGPKIIRLEECLPETNITAFEDPERNQRNDDSASVQSLGGHVSPQIWDNFDESYETPTESPKRFPTVEDIFSSDESNDDEPQPQESQDGASDLEISTSKLLQPLFYGGQSKSTVGEALLGLCTIFKSHYCSKSLLSDVIQFVFKLMPDINNWPRSKYMFYKEMNGLVPDNTKEANVMYFCSRCSLEAESRNVTKCTRCQCDKFAVYVKPKFESTVKHLFEKRNLASLIDDYHVSRNDNSDLITDIVDGKLYKRIANKLQYDMGLVFNTDGFPVSGSSKSQVWPFFFTICDINPRVRNYFVMLHSLYFAPVKPDMSTILPHVVKDLLSFEREGIKWTDPRTGTENLSHGHLICAALDAQARYPIQNINPYNAPNGCSMCEAPGLRVPSGRGTARIYPFQERQSTLRSSENMAHHAYDLQFNPEVNQAREEVGVDAPLHIYGVCGFSEFHVCEHFDVGCGCSTEYLHSCLLGSCKRNLILITDSQHSGEDYSVHKFLPLINKMISALTPPNTFKRLPRGLSDIPNFKGSELQHWLIIFSLVCLEKFWPKTYLDHHALLVFSIHTLLRDDINKEDLSRVRNALSHYCRLYPDLYRVEDQTFNLHLLTHYVDAVENLGPLFAHSTFVFESENFKLKKSIHSTSKTVAQELLLTTRICNFGNVLKIICNGNLNDTATVKVKLLGAPVNPVTIPASVLNFLRDVIFPEQDDYNVHQATFYSRASVSNIVFTTDTYKNASKTVSYYALYINDLDEVAPCKILHFVDVNNNFYFICCDLLDLGAKYETSVHSIFVQHMRLFEYSEAMKIVCASKLRSPLVVMKNVGCKNDEMLYCSLPNMVQINL